MVLPLVGVMGEEGKKKSSLLKLSWAEGVETVKQKNLQYL